ncbi:hypothetical protein ACP70R_026585 [Stipagrostis hirtigluma subsp. patula]
MKHLLLLLPLLIISLLFITGKTSQEPIYDTDGTELSTDLRYHILLADQGIGGGLSFAVGSIDRCLFHVFHEHDEEAIGTKVLQFKPWNASSDGAVRLSTNIIIQFDVFTTCVEATHWYVDVLPLMSLPELRQYVAVGKPESQNFIPPSMFRVERYGSTTAGGYKLVWCTDDGVCQDLGLDVYQKRNRWLTVNGTPLAVVFKKAHK